jgi:hypothetical protein
VLTAIAGGVGLLVVIAAAVVGGMWYAESSRQSERLAVDAELEQMYREYWEADNRVYELSPIVEKMKLGETSDELIESARLSNRMDDIRQICEKKYKISPRDLGTVIQKRRMKTLE